MVLGKVAVIGDADSVLVFRGLGFNVITTENPGFALQEIKRLNKSNYQVIFITENLAAENREILDHYADQFEPAIILIPSGKGGENFALEYLRESVKRAIGIDFLKIENEE